MLDLQYSLREIPGTAALPAVPPPLLADWRGRREIGQWLAWAGESAQALAEPPPNPATDGSFHEEIAAFARRTETLIAQLLASREAPPALPETGPWAMLPAAVVQAKEVSAAFMFYGVIPAVPYNSAEKISLHKSRARLAEFRQWWHSERVYHCLLNVLSTIDRGGQADGGLPVLTQQAQPG